MLSSISDIFMIFHKKIDAAADCGVNSGYHFFILALPHKARIKTIPSNFVRYCLHPIILISDQFHEKIRRQALADQGKRPQAGCRLARAFDDEQRVSGGEDFYGFD